MSTINTGQSRQTFTQEKWYAYSGVIQGDISVPASITLIDMPSTGLSASFIKIQPYFGAALAISPNDGLGLSVLIDGVEIFKAQSLRMVNGEEQIVSDSIELFVPQQSRLQILSLNTASNNNQDRGCTVLGWYV
jgi:hypothetical protein